MDGDQYLYLLIQKSKLINKYDYRGVAWLFYKLNTALSYKQNYNFYLKVQR